MNNRGAVGDCAGVWSICGGNGQSFSDETVGGWVDGLDFRILPVLFAQETEKPYRTKQPDVAVGPLLASEGF